MRIETKLFYLRTNPYFGEGTLFELREDAALILPDGGDGEPKPVERSWIVERPPFAENVLPGECSIKVTSFEIGGTRERAESVTVDKSIHFQVLVIPRAVSSVAVTDRVKGFEVDSYFPSGSEAEFRLHIGHLPPGFYEAAISFANAATGRLTFIKFFPPRFSDGYSELAKEPRIAASAPGDIADETQGKAALLNKALELATEWGENFRKPIHGRIRVFYPELKDDEIETLTATVREAESFIYRLAEGELAGEISEADIPPSALERYPWLNTHNLNRLSGIGMYYARR